jgi:UPF0755 protein
VGRFLIRLFIAAVLACGALGGAVAWWLGQPLAMLPAPGAESVDLSIEPGTSARGVAQAVADAGVQVNPTLLYWWARLSRQDRQMRAGSYEIEAGATPRSILQKLVRGEEALRAVTLVEGWTFVQVLEELLKSEHLKHDTRGLEADSIMQKLGKPGLAAEGRFFPDTYTYAKGASDLAVLKRALRAMDKKLEAAWSQRQPDTPLKSPEQALILASIVEKETGKGSDRPQIAGVFTNRMRIGMPLQTDPTVIYGMGTKFDGNLRKRDLQTDTPWNTYTRRGLPPTPIAMPGKSALLAAVQPAQTKALYFVARGDGSSQFSATLDEHNRAVNKFQRGQ